MLGEPEALSAISWRTLGPAGRFVEGQILALSSSSSGSIAIFMKTCHLVIERSLHLGDQKTPRLRNFSVSEFEVHLFQRDSNGFGTLSGRLLNLS